MRAIVHDEERHENRVIENVRSVRVYDLGEGRFENEVFRTGLVTLFIHGRSPAKLEPEPALSEEG